MPNPCAGAQRRKLEQEWPEGPWISDCAFVDLPDTAKTDGLFLSHALMEAMLPPPPEGCEGVPSTPAAVDAHNAAQGRELFREAPVAIPIDAGISRDEVLDAYDRAIALLQKYGFTVPKGRARRNTASSERNPIHWPGLPPESPEARRLTARALRERGLAYEAIADELWPEERLSPDAKKRRIRDLLEAVKTDLETLGRSDAKGAP